MTREDFKWDRRNKTCPRGHTIGSGVIVIDNNGSLYCQACQNLNAPYWTAKKKETETRHA